jgi:hypothetical protein
MVHAEGSSNHIPYNTIPYPIVAGNKGL